MQLDVKDQFLSEAFPLVLKKLETLRHIWSNTKSEKLFEMLKKWDYVMEKTSVEASLYHAW